MARDDISSAFSCCCFSVECISVGSAEEWAAAPPQVCATLPRGGAVSIRCGYQCPQLRCTVERVKFDIGLHGTRCNEFGGRTAFFVVRRDKQKLQLHVLARCTCQPEDRQHLISLFSREIVESFPFFSSASRTSEASPEHCREFEKLFFLRFLRTWTILYETITRDALRYVSQNVAASSTCL